MLLKFVIIVQILLLKANADSPSLTINRSKSHKDKSGDYTPLVVSLSTEDKAEKVKPVDLICIVDVSGSMYGEPLNLVKESLKYLVKLMSDTDNFALVTFSDDSYLINGLTKMTKENKNLILDKIAKLEDIGGTNIYSGLEEGLKLIKNDYSSGDRIASMILLSDGADNYYYNRVVSMFEDLIERQGKKNYVFTLNTFGYGSYYDYNLMNNIALIRDGAYFNIDKLGDVNDAFLKIYGSLSTVSNVNVQLKIQSKFHLTKVYGIEDMYDANITSDAFNVKLIQVIYGKKYDFTLLVDVPENTPIGTEVLNATVSSLGLNAKYLWDEKYSQPAYEEYIKCIVVIIFIEGYNNQYNGISILEEGIEWMKANYNGTRNWIKEFNGAITDLGNSAYIGKANLLSKITELKTSRIGIHYDEGNSYQRELIDNSHGIDVSKLELIIIEGSKILSFTKEINYYYFYLKDGNGKINNLHFSGPSSSLIIYSDDISENIQITSNSMECYFWNESVTNRIQNIVDFNKGGKFIIKKDFPFDFYTRIDGKRDITFNIEFLNLDYNSKSSINIGDLIVITAYILTDNQIDELSIDIDSLTNFQVFNGTFDDKLKLGKIVLKKEDISNNLNSIYNNYLYVIITKNFYDNITINSVEGQFLFVPTDYVYSSIPKNYYIFSNLEINGTTPHLYTLEKNPSLENKFIIEFYIFGEELDFKILNYQNYVDGIIDYYNDYDKYIIEKTNNSNKLSVNITQSNDENTTFDKIILSIYSSNKDHIAGSNITNLSYAFKYKTDHEEYNETEEIKVVTKINIILLGFAKFTYVRNLKICYFFIYFVYIKQTIYAKQLIINIHIRYGKLLRGLQENVSTKSVCKLVENEFDNQKKYNCTFETNGEEIENIQIDKNIESGDGDIEFSDIDISPIGLKYINNLQNVGDSDPFEKKLYILYNSKVVVDNDNNEFNITGNISDNGFNYKNLNLELALLENSNEKNGNISCISIDEGENIFTLKCNTDNEMKGQITSAFSNLGNENLLVNFLDSGNNTELNFEQKLPNISKYKYNIYIKSSGGISTGGIIAIIIPCIAIFVIVSVIVILSLKKKPNIKENMTISSKMNSIENNASTLSGIQ